jgi:hypothetical protein
MRADWHKSRFSGKITQNACKLPQIAFKLTQTVQSDVFGQNHSKCVKIYSNCVQTGTNRANGCFPAKSLKMRSNWHNPMFSGKSLKMSANWLKLRSSRAIWCFQSKSLKMRANWIKLPSN